METASWVFGGLLVVFIMLVVGYRLVARDSRPVDATTHNLLGFLCATLAGLFAFFFSGSVVVNVAPTAGRFGTLGIQAAGGAALFVVVLWWWRSDNNPLPPQDLSTLRSLAAILRTIDDLYPGLRSIARPELPNLRSYSLTARINKDTIFIDSTNNDAPIARITSADLLKLPEDDRAYIKAKEMSMRTIVKEWSSLYPNRLLGSEEQQRTIKERLRTLAKEICKDLNGIFKHLGQIGMELEDHYGAARSICWDFENNNT